MKEENTSSDEIIFKRDRTTLYDRLASYGYTVGKRKKIGPDAVRRGFGICYLAEGGHINELQKIYGHSTIELTQRYLEIDGRDAVKNLSSAHQTMRYKCS